MASTILSQLLDEFFGERSSNASQARALGFDAARLSRLRTGSHRLTDRVAQTLAEKLEALEKGKATELKVQLLAAAKDAHRPKADGTSIQQAVDLFHELARPGALLVVEYRDWPVTPIGGPYGEVAELAARAIAHGLSFAMFLPFAPSTQEDRQRLPARVWRYRDDLIERVREIYSELFAAAKRVQLSDSTAFDPEKQLVLYERADGAGDQIGFQSRLFYVAIPVDGIRPRREIWEWVAVPEPGAHAFLRRANLELDVIYRQYFEVTAFWHRHSRLPTAAQLPEGTRAAIELAWFDAASGEPCPKSIWTVSPACPASLTSKTNSVANSNQKSKGRR